MMDTLQTENYIARIKVIADKTPQPNRDINYHIESCKISMIIINQLKDNIKALRDMLILRDEQIRQLEEKTLMLETKNKQMLKEQYKLANELLKRSQ